MKATRFLLAGALAGAALLAIPTSVPAFALLGFTLPLTQRDFRVNPTSFVDASANDNTGPQVNYPGATGATMALWKAASEWASYRHGVNGSGDASQGAIGGDNSNTSVIDNPMANFDFSFQGVTAGNGGSTGNVISATQSTLGGGVLAATFLPGGTGAGGWQMLYDDPQWTWDDGPSAGVTGWCIQGIGVHELGHALGLGHTAAGGATMVAGVAPFAVSLRSIEQDDEDGVESNYGVLAATKPRITALSGAFALGGTLTITGTNFAATGNEVWFTSTAATGVPRTVTGVASTGGGTSISVVIPSTAPLPGDGDVFVRTPGVLGSNLSNGWPIDMGSGLPPVLTSIGPNPVPLLGIPQASMTINGTDLGPVGSVNIGGVVVSGAALTTTATTISFVLPLLPVLGPTTVTATAPAGTSNALPLTVNPANPAVLQGPGATGASLTFTADTFTAPGSFVVLCMSTFNSPSVLPGMVSLDIGAGFSALFLFPTLVANASQGKTTVSFVVPPGGAGVTAYFQSVSVPPAFTTPFGVSNVLPVLVLF